jgi:tyrosyl-tRNA synthetase
MGRNTNENLDFSQFLYPAMQSTDIHALDLDLVHSGTDQRKIHMLMREVFPKLNWKVPVSLHHHLLPGLTEPVKLGLTEDSSEDLRISSKMSKSKPMSGIFIHDDNKTIEMKIKKAFCPIGVSENNPILEIIRYIIFHRYKEFIIERPSKYGGTISYSSYSELKEDYDKQKIHPQDIKQSTSLYLCKLIEPIRNHFKNNEPLL